MKSTKAGRKLILRQGLKARSTGHSATAGRTHQLCGPGLQARPIRSNKKRIRPLLPRSSSARRGRIDRRVVRIREQHLVIDRSSTSVSPPGRSVRPIDPANSVSPTNRLRSDRSAFSTVRHTPPGQCPGVCGCDDVAAERQRPAGLVESRRRLGLHRKAERPALLHDPFVGSCRPDAGRPARPAPPSRV